MTPVHSQWYWCSFLDRKRPPGSRFLGVSIVGPCETAFAVMPTAWRKRCNPGGEVRFEPLTTCQIAAIPEGMRNVLILPQDVPDVQHLIDKATN